jgi:hypothetical protein
VHLSTGRVIRAWCARSMLLLGMLALPACGGEHSPASPPLPPEAQAPLRGLLPDGDSPWPFAFQWDGTAADQRVRVVVADTNQNALHEFEARGLQAQAPASLRDRLSPGDDYLWRVAALDDNDAETRTSTWVRFSIDP